MSKKLAAIASALYIGLTGCCPKSYPKIEYIKEKEKEKETIKPKPKDYCQDPKDWQTESLCKSFWGNIIVTETNLEIPMYISRPYHPENILLKKPDRIYVDHFFWPADESIETGSLKLAIRGYGHINSKIKIPKDTPLCPRNKNFDLNIKDKCWYYNENSIIGIYWEMTYSKNYESFKVANLNADIKQAFSR